MRFIALLLFVSLFGCAGHLETRPVSSLSKPVKGVVYYAPTYVKVRYAFSALVDNAGKVVGTAGDKKCLPLVQKEEIQLIADLRYPYALDLTSGFLSANKLGVTLANGMLTSVNMESVSKAPEFLTAVATTIEKLGVLGAKPGPDAACNASPIIVSFTPVSLGQ
jgi:hypothetical protein